MAKRRFDVGASLVERARRRPPGGGAAVEHPDAEQVGGPLHGDRAVGEGDEVGVLRPERPAGFLRPGHRFPQGLGRHAAGHIEQEGHGNLPGPGPHRRAAEREEQQPDRGRPQD